MAFTQDDRFLSLETPAGKDALLIQNFGLSERVSGLFTLSLDMVAEPDKAKSIQAQNLLGKDISLKVSLASGERYFHAVLTHFEEGEFDSRFQHFKAEASPWLWLLTLSSGCKIFQNLTVPEIVTRVFRDHGFTRFRSALTGSYRKRDYCVQYRETAFQFVSRLLEEEGIFYYFEHTQSSHTLVLGDAVGALSACPQGKVFYELDAGYGEWEDTISSWHQERDVRAGKYTLRDYHFQQPDRNQEASANAKAPVSNASHLELYDYPGEYAKVYASSDPNQIATDAKAVVKLRIEQEEAFSKRASGTSTCRAFTTGQHFVLSGHPTADGQHTLTALQHTGVQSPAYHSDQEVSPSYSNTFTCIPYAEILRPQRITERAVLPGIQTATVVGKAGEEIWTDQYGRIRVQFHWDRDGSNDENSSCWVKVAQMWAGTGWGTQFIPRIGQEVVVHFLEGDPDQPIVIGSIYNASHKHPFELPANQTQSGVRTRSSKGGSSTTFNELRFEDKKGSEDIYFHAEKDFHRVVENNDDLKVHNQQTEWIKNNRTKTIEEGDDKFDIKKGSRETTIYKDETFTLKTGNRKETIELGNEDLEIKSGDRKVVLDMGNDDLVIKMGNQSTKLALGKSTTEAMQSIELKVGASSIKVDQSGVTISGMMIKLDAMASGQFSSVGPLTLKGLPTLIN